MIKGTDRLEEAVYVLQKQFQIYIVYTPQPHEIQVWARADCDAYDRIVDATDTLTQHRKNITIVSNAFKRSRTGPAVPTKKETK